MLSTKTNKVEWGEIFPNYFDVNMDAVYFSQDTDFNIIIKKPTAETYDEDEEKYYMESLKILPAGSKKPIEYTSPVKLFLNPKILTPDVMKDESEEIEISSKSLNEDEYIFKYQPKNNELTKSLQQILDLIESNDHLGIDNYNDLVNKFDDLLIENDMDSINSVHVEMIAATLIRDAETGKPLDFSQETLRPYVINRVSKTVLEAPLAVRLSFERLNDQLVDLSTCDEDEISMMDYLYD